MQRSIESRFSPGRASHRHGPAAWRAWCLLCAVLLAGPGLAFGQEAGEVVSVLGQVEIQRGERWQPLTPGEAIAPGERIRTGQDGRAAIQLRNGIQLKLNANSELELKTLSQPQPPGADGRLLHNLMRVLQGEIWIRSDGRALDVQIRSATASIRGTEFDLATLGPDTAYLGVLEGLVEFANARGKVLVAPNEFATAKGDEAPRKSVLVNPLDSVQWSLYYPGFTSHRDYPLTAEGADDATTRRGWSALDANDPRTALAEFDRARPATLMSRVGSAAALYQLNRWDASARVSAETARRYPDSPLPLVQLAQLDLVRGQADSADQRLDQALARDPGNALALGLRAQMRLVQNRRPEARAAAEQAVAAHPDSPSALIALSLVEQSAFALDAALAASRKASAAAPESAAAAIQESRLLFGMGRLEEASARAEQARRLAPADSQVLSTWGFLQLARGNQDAAADAFTRAIAADSTRGEPHLGLGLVHFRQNRTQEALDELRKASLLEPQVALYHSYLGKAYYELREDALAAKHLALAEQLDPRDPTPYLYDAIRLEAANRPVEAMQALLTSAALNDNRAVYRSRLLLDEDQATRAATLGRVFDQVGFDRLGWQEGASSVTQDPANYSAHLLLTDAYAAQPRQDMARASELLQAQLLQPLGLTPIRPRLAETDLWLPEGAGPTSVSLNEYSPLFVRDGVSLFSTAMAGNHGTLGDEMVATAVADRVSLSFGQFHYQSDGYRPNNDVRHDIQTATVQFAPIPELSLQAEFRRRDTNQGDLSSNFDPDAYSTTLRDAIRQESLRLGARLSPSPSSTWLASYITTNKTNTQTAVVGSGTPLTADWSATSEQDGYQAELQYLFRRDRLNLIAGASRYDLDSDDLYRLDLTRSLGFICRFIDCTIETNNDMPLERDQVYAYANLESPGNLLWTLGGSYDDLTKGDYQLHEFSPKFGLQWSPSASTHLRLAAYQAVKPARTVEQTLEPTQIAGFGQFYDDTNGSRIEGYGIGLDQRLGPNLSAGVEAHQRRIEIPASFYAVHSGETSGRILTVDVDDDRYRAYLYWTLDRRWTLALEPEYERQNRADTSTSAVNDLPLRVETTIVPLTIRYAGSSGLFSALRGSYVDQSVERRPDSTVQDGHDSFLVVDATLGYRLPRRLGSVSLNVFNLFGQEFYYQDDNFQTSEAVSPRFVPDRQVMLRVSLNL